MHFWGWFTPFGLDDVAPSGGQVLVEVSVYGRHVWIRVGVGLDVRDGQIQLAAHRREPIQKGGRFVDVGLAFVALDQALDHSFEILAVQGERGAP